LLLPSPSHSFSAPVPAGLVTTFDCLRFETLPTWRATSPYLYPTGIGWPSYTPRHWVPFSSPPATLRWRDSTPPPHGSIKVKVTLRLTVGQSVSKSWCRTPSGAHDQLFITVREYQIKVKVTLRLTVSQSVSKSWYRAPSGAHDQIFISV
jgi:hypothetical protein